MTKLQAAHHHNVIDLPAVMQKSTGNSANFSEALAFIEAHCRRVLCGDSQFQLPNAYASRVICYRVNKSPREPGAAQVLTDVDNDDRGAMGHLACTLKKQTGYSDGFLILKYDEDRVVQALLPLFDG